MLVDAFPEITLVLKSRHRAIGPAPHVYREMPMPKNDLYDADIVAWSEQQAHWLRAGALDRLDLEHLAEEIEDVGKSEQRELASRLSLLLAHLLKWQFQPERRGSSSGRNHSMPRGVAHNVSLRTRMLDRSSGGRRRHRSERRFGVFQVDQGRVIDWPRAQSAASPKNPCMTSTTPSDRRLPRDWRSSCATRRPRHIRRSSACP